MHLQKLSVGSESIASLQDWQDIVVSRRAARGLSAHHEHVTRMFPKQAEALIDGGSIYWVIKGLSSAAMRLRRLSKSAQVMDARPVQF